MGSTLRILYAAGPGNVIGTYHHWVKGEDDPSQVSVTYSGQFYDLCRALDAQAYVISSYSDRQLLHDDRFTLEHCPVPLRNASGLLYHIGQLWYGIQLLLCSVRFKANVAVVADGTTHWFMLSLLPWFGIQVIPSLHCTLWRKYCPQSFVEKVSLRLSRHLFARQCFAILTLSDDISEQVKTITANQPCPIVAFLPLYGRTEFSGVDKPNENRALFRVLFAGRIELNKGVFELLDIAKRFAAQGRREITFAVCGSGSALESLRLAAKEAGVEANFVCYGHCSKPQMREMFKRSHVVIVPTRTDFVEGFNKVVAEAILSGRPVVTSSVCPALSYVREAVVEVPPDDTQAYGNALLKLCDEPEFYEQKRQHCLLLQEQFYDISQSWGAQLKSVLTAIQEASKVAQP